MPTKHLELPDIWIDGETKWSEGIARRVVGALDSQTFGALQAFTQNGGGVLKLPGADSFKVTAGSGRSVNVAAGAGVAAHSVYDAVFLQTRGSTPVSNLEANATLYIHASIEIAANDSRETAIPLLISSSSPTLDGAIPLAQVTTDASNVTGVTDLRAFITLGGESGSVWRTGAGVPDNALGADGDFYINTTNFDFYEKASGAYVVRGNMKGAPGASGQDGADGEDGQDGAPGSLWLRGATVPDNALGVDNDWYLNTSSGGAWLKSGGAWAFQFNLKGPPGAPGGTLNWIEAGWQSGENYEVNDGLAHGTPVSSYRCKVAHTAATDTEPGVGANWQSVWMVTASAGAAGATGAAGTLWYSGIGAPDNATGSDGAFYFDTASSDIYKKISGAWSFQVNIAGIGIPAGGNAGHALVKATGDDYDGAWVSPTALITGVGVGGVLSGSLPNPGFALDMATQAELDAVGNAKQSTSEKGQANGYAELDGTGKVPSAQLPAFVDDVIESANFAALPSAGESGKIYVTLDDGKTFRWSGSAYVEISASLALGETSSTAYRGDRGKTAYDHSQATGNPHDTAIGDISGLQDALDNAGGSETTASLTASEALVAGNLVNVWNDSGTAKMRKADASDKRPAYGFVKAAVSSGAIGTVYFSGLNDAISGATPGDGFLGESGAVGSTPAAAGIAQKVGIVLSATSLLFAPGVVVELA